MGITALIMAGGKGSRLNLSEEKPLIKLINKPLIEFVLKGLRDAKNIDSIRVAVSHHTPKTTRLLSILQVDFIKTPGKGYVHDMAYAIKKLKLETVLLIGADLPLITGQIIDLIINKFNTCRKPALNVVVPLKTRKKLGLSEAYTFSLDGKKVLPAGINIINGTKIDEKELLEEIFLLDRTEVALNVNTQNDLKIAKKLLTTSVKKET